MYFSDLLVMISTSSTAELGSVSLEHFSALLGVDLHSVWVQHMHCECLKWLHLVHWGPEAGLFLFTFVGHG